MVGHYRGLTDWMLSLFSPESSPDHGGIRMAGFPVRSWDYSLQLRPPGRQHRAGHRYPGQGSGVIYIDSPSHSGTPYLSANSDGYRRERKIRDLSPRNGYHFNTVKPLPSALRFIVCAGILFGSIHIAEAYAEQHRRVDNSPYSAYSESDAQEKHIDSVDRVSQDNKEKIQQILVRIEGDEDYVKGGSFMLLSLLSLGALKLFKGKPA